MEDQPIGKFQNTNLLKFLIVICSFVVVLLLLFFGQTQTNNRVDREVSITSTSNKQLKLTDLTDEDTIALQLDDAEVYLEIARSPQKRQQGLMYKEKLDENYGMLFIFDNESNLSFWMKNTLIPLDIIFLNKDFEITKIHTNTKTNQTLETYPSETPSQYVIELTGGQAIKLGLVEGASLKALLKTSI